MLTQEEFYIQSLRNHLYYLRSIKNFCITIELSFYKNNIEYINSTSSFLNRSTELLENALSYTNELVSSESLKRQIYITDYTLFCEKITEKLFDIDINTVITEKELKLKEGIREINDELIEKINALNNNALLFAKNFRDFCNEINNKMESNELFSFLYSDFFYYLSFEVNTYIDDLERIMKMESYSPIYAVGQEYNFAIILQKTACFIRDWVDVSNKNIYDIATYYVNSFNEIISTYLKASISPEVQRKLSIETNNLLTDYQDFLEDILNKLINKKLYFITAPVSIDNIYTSVNFYKYILEMSSKED